MDPQRGELPQPQATYLEPESERLGQEELRSLQLQLFVNELRRVRHENTFYKRIYDAAGLDVDKIRTLDDVRRVPIVRKKDILLDQNARPPFGERLQVPENEIAQIVESSGASGMGREVQALAEQDLDLICRAKRFQFFWPGARKGTVVGLHIPVTMAAGALWSLEALRALGASPLRLGNMAVEDRLGYMNRYGVELMQASTSYIMRLEHAAHELGMDLQRDFPRLRGIFVGGGGWGVKWAQEHAARWNVRLYEVYASSQRIFAYSCEWGILRGDDRGVLHFMSHLALAEIIDPATGEPARDGEEGEIVITPFGMTASPLVRYATGDRARFYAAGRCPCGRQFEGIEAGSVGRVDDMMRIKEINVWPEAIDDVVFARPEVVEYRGDLYVDPSGREVARILVQCRPDVPADVGPGLCADLAASIHHRVGIHFVVESWEGESLIGGMSGISFDLKTRGRWVDRRTETREAAQTPA